MYATEDYLRYFTRLAGIVEYKGLVLSHAPVHKNQLSRWYMNVHGHLHTRRVMQPTIDDSDSLRPKLNLSPDPRYVCVSAEQVDLTPVPFDWVLNKWAEAN